MKAASEGRIIYTSLIEPDGKTFVHVLVYLDAAAKKIVTDSDAFNAFQAALEPNLESPPAAEEWGVAGATFTLH